RDARARRLASAPASGTLPVVSSAVRTPSAAFVRTPRVFSFTYSSICRPHSHTTAAPMIAPRTKALLVRIEVLLVCDFRTGPACLGASALVSNSGHSNCVPTIRLRHDRHSPAIARSTHVLPTPLSPAITWASPARDPCSFDASPRVIHAQRPQIRPIRNRIRTTISIAPTMPEDRTHTSDNPSGAGHQTGAEAR